MEQLLNFLSPLISAYAGNAGIVLQIISIIGTLRLLVKPIMAIANIYVNFTPSNDDNIILAKLEKSKIYKGVLFAVDWLLSIKIKK